MLAIQDTAYPRLKRTYTPRALADLYTPTSAEFALVAQVTKTRTTKVCFLLALKTFQCIGYFLPLREVPLDLVRHVAGALGVTTLDTATLTHYDRSSTRWRHHATIRAHLEVHSFDRTARHVVVEAMGAAAHTKHDLADLVNVALEELVRHRYELPKFTVLARAALRVRSAVTRRLYHEVAAALSFADRARVDALFVLAPDAITTPWNALKQDAGRPSLTHLKDAVDRLGLLQGWSRGVDGVAHLPDIKVKHFAAEAKTLDAGRMLALEPAKRYTLATAFLYVHTAQAHDDVADMFLRRMQQIHQRGREALAAYHAQYQQRTDALVATLREVVTAYRSDGNDKDRLAALDGVLGSRSEEVLADCDAHLAYAGNNYFPFLWRAYASHRATLFRMVKLLTLRSTSQDTTLEQVIAFLLRHEGTKRDWLPIVDEVWDGSRLIQRTSLVDLAWIPDGWWRLVTGQRTRTPAPLQVNRRQWEVCVFSQVLWELKAGDLAVEGSDAYADYRDQLISPEEYAARVGEYGQLVGLPVDGASFVAVMHHRLAATAAATDHAFPANQGVRLEHGEPIVTRAKQRGEPDGLQQLEAYIAGQLQEVTILDILADTEWWLNWTRFFGPISGHEAKVLNPVAAYLATVFGYGCNLGPSQTARAVGTLDRRQLAWINLRHVTVETLEQASREVINAYRRFALPRYWGSGKHASADGTKWDVYEQNLLAEYHIRYGGYGGIGYYHVSDTYIALFSHFIPCGVWEAVYLLDGLLKNTSDIQPDTIHADTQGQSEAVFGLATLFGIQLMPRIRNWKHLRFYRPVPNTHYQHIDEVFCATPINWALIARHLPDMLRVALSIKAGRITASTLLRRLNSYSKKNKLYHAFCELGRVVRTNFLLQYLADEDLRTTIHAATNKSEAFNGFVQWLAFGGEGVIRENDRLEQLKVVKYNHLVANCVIFYNVHAVSTVLDHLQRQGHSVESNALAALSPYLQQHINRFGRYQLNVNRCPPPVDYDLVPFPLTADVKEAPTTTVVEQHMLWSADGAS